MPLISERVALARAGQNPTVLARLRSGWAVIGDLQLLPGYCLLLEDPVVPSLNDLPPAARAVFLDDMARLGDAILAVTGARRINYEILGNAEPELHAHLFPRFDHEPPELRHRPAWFYDRAQAPRFSPEQHGDLFRRLHAALHAAPLAVP